MASVLKYKMQQAAYWMWDGNLSTPLLIFIIAKILYLHPPNKREINFSNELRRK